MRNFIVYLALLLCLFCTKMFAQEPTISFECRAKDIATNIENITKSEKEALKKEVESVNLQLEKNEITKLQADEMKQQLAEKRAKNIETRVAVEQQNLNELVQQKVDGKMDIDTLNRKVYKIGKLKITKKDSVLVWQDKHRTTLQLVFAMGLNNVLTNNAIANSDFRYWGSHFYEVGLTLNTRLSKTNNLLHLKYGYSVVFNNLRPTDNREFVVLGNQTNLQTSPIKLEDSRFRNVQINFPIHLEFDFTKPKLINDKTIFDSHRTYRFGIGGYLGYNDEKTQYTETSMNHYYTKTETEGDYNTSNFIYGLSAYVGHQATSLYVKYDMNPLFKDNAVVQHNISLGVRFDFN
jgi:uncharacterized coiled-coil protein SlyX